MRYSFDFISMVTKTILGFLSTKLLYYIVILLVKPSFFSEFCSLDIPAELPNWDW